MIPNASLNFTIPVQETITALTCNDFYINEFTSQIKASMLLGLLFVVLYWLERPFKELSKREKIFKISIMSMYVAYVIITLYQLKGV